MLVMNGGSGTKINDAQPWKTLLLMVVVQGSIDTYVNVQPSKAR